jgi:hypothetical protein
MAYWLGVSSSEDLTVSDSELLNKVIYGMTFDGFLPIDHYTQASPYVEGGEELKDLLTSQYQDLGISIIAFNVTLNVSLGTRLI